MQLYRFHADQVRGGGEFSLLCKNIDTAIIMQTTTTVDFCYGLGSIKATKGKQDDGVVR